MSLPPLGRWPRIPLTIIRTFGLRGMIFRGVHEARRRGGWFRRHPRYKVDVPAAMARGPKPIPWCVNRSALVAGLEGRHEPATRAKRVLAGEYQAYSWDWRSLPTDSGWHRHPTTGYEFPREEPWWRIQHLVPGSDIKDIWEPGRFSWIYDLVRLGVLADDPEDFRLAHQFVTLGVREWLGANPPFSGVQWSCGQETAIRALAILYAESNLAPGDHALLELLAMSGERIADAIGYGISQRNNHGISEAAGLVCIGTRLRGAHPEASRWERKGTRLLRRLVLEQFAEDGWYIQHSFNYARLALQMVTAAEAALLGQDETLGPRVRARILVAKELLERVMDPASGEVPNYGANDGAYALPVAVNRYCDFRPALVMAAAVFRLPGCDGRSECEDVMAWLGAPSARIDSTSVDQGGVSTSQVEHPTIRCGSSGWVSVVTERVRVFLRAGEYHSRPSHSDALHLDIRIDGRQVVVDPGTVSYNGAPPWRNALRFAAVHNGPIINGEDPALSGPRFLWWTWPDAVIDTAEEVDGIVIVCARIKGLAQRRVIIDGKKGVVRVEDVSLDRRARRQVVSWLLHPDADPACIRCEPEGRVLCSGTLAPGTTFSPFYGLAMATSAIMVGADAGGGEPITIVSTISA